MVYYNSAPVGVFVLAVLFMSTIEQSRGSSILSDCGGSKAVAKIDSVEIGGCDLQKDTSCLMVKGTNASINVKFTTKNTVSSARIRVSGKLGPAWVPFPVQPEEACGNYGLQCPVASSGSGQVNMIMPVRPAYPKLKLQVQYKLIDERDEPIFCIEFPARIVDKP